MDSLIPFSLYGDPSTLLMLQLIYGGFCDTVLFFRCKVILPDGFIFFNGSLSSCESFKNFNFLKRLDLFIRLDNCKGGTFWLISLQI